MKRKALKTNSETAQHFPLHSSSIY